MHAGGQDDALLRPATSPAADNAKSDLLGA